jgi:hypothetical protein
MVKLLVSLMVVGVLSLQAAPLENNYTINNQTPFHLLIAFNKIDAINTSVKVHNSNNITSKNAVIQGLTNISASLTHGALEASATYVPPNTTSTVNTGGYCNYGYWIIPAVPAGASIPQVGGTGIAWQPLLFTNAAPLNMLLNAVGASQVTWIGAMNDTFHLSIAEAEKQVGNPVATWAHAATIGLKSHTTALSCPAASFAFLLTGGRATAQCNIEEPLSAPYQSFSGDQCANRNITLTYDSSNNTITASNGYGAASVINHDYVS